jgi:hypothetical protein
MKSIFFAAGLMVLSGCVTHENVQAGKPVIGGYSPDEKEQVVSSGRYRSFVGSLPNEFAYGWSVQPDGLRSGYVTPQAEFKRGPVYRNWRFTCVPDKMDGGHDCTIRANEVETYSLPREALHLSSRNGGRPYEICVVGHDFPGRAARIKVGNSSPVNIGSDGCTSSQSMISKVLSGSKVVLEGVSWPYDRRWQKTADTRGVEYVMGLVQHSLSQKY